MDLAEAANTKIDGLSSEYRSIIVENEAMMAKCQQEVDEMLLNMEKMRVDKERLKDENNALRK